MIRSVQKREGWITEGKEVGTVAIIQEVKKKKEIEITRASPKPKAKKEKKSATQKQTAETTEELNPISRFKEWKLLYRPYPFRTTSNSSSPTSNPKISSRVKSKNPDQYKGLCRNCKKRKTCKLPKSEGGVWHCEEYE